MVQAESGTELDKYQPFCFSQCAGALLMLSIHDSPMSDFPVRPLRFDIPICFG
jgi:hypothetical protein